MARRAAGAVVPHGDDFSFVSPLVKYVLFFFNMLFWMISMVMVAVGVYARLLKHAEAAMACLAVDPAILLIVVGVLMFLITFCGCIGSLRENICLLQTFSICLTVVFLLQLAAGVLGFVFSDKARGKVSEIINGAIVHYRDDLDLQNLIDFGQKELLRGGLLQGLVPEHVLQLHRRQPQPRAVLGAFLLLPPSRRRGHAGHELPGGQRIHLHQRLHRQAGQLDPQQPLPAGGHRSGPGHPPARGDPALSDPRQPDQRPDQAAALQSAAPGRPLVLSPREASASVGRRGFLCPLDILGRRADPPSWQLLALPSGEGHHLLEPGQTFARPLLPGTGQWPPPPATLGPWESLCLGLFSLKQPRVGAICFQASRRAHGDAAAAAEGAESGVCP
ncbi:tetraspanin-33 isoform X2 [Apteryx mantelli]|uniref:Tetraspanin-33 isoform X2 n=1 Tax=Apteryx mantelli TaxID=2696672 RepID=A0ABM4G918_9AVES